MDGQWHYLDEKSGKRSGPADTEKLVELVDQQRLRRSTLVWNPAMPAWASASETELAALFADDPPPLPGRAVSRWAAYVLALLPLFGTLAALQVSIQFADQLQLTPQEAFDHWGWLIAFFVANGIFGEIDEFVLRRAGVMIRGVALIAGFLVPLYLFFSGRALRRDTDKSFVSAYLPCFLWFAAIAAAILVIISVPL